MILTQIKFSYKDVKDNKIYNIYRLHQIIWKLFDAEVRKKQGERILFADKGVEENIRKVVVLSTTPAKDSSYDMVYREIPESYLMHDLYNFEIDINPVKKVSSSKKYVAITKYNEVSDWFIKKANACGFIIDNYLSINKITATEFTKDNGDKVVINTANISGSLKVGDREKFINSVRNGIGRGKAYGHGFLQITPKSLF